MKNIILSGVKRSSNKRKKKNCVNDICAINYTIISRFTVISSFSLLLHINFIIKRLFVFLRQSVL